MPLEERRQAAHVAMRAETDPWERFRIRLLAEDPGELIAWVAP